MSCLPHPKPKTTNRDGIALGDPDRVHVHHSPEHSLLPAAALLNIVGIYRVSIADLTAKTSVCVCGGWVSG